MSCRHGDVLRRKIGLAAPLLRASSSLLWDDPRLAELFPRFLLGIHGSVRATVPLMMDAIGELRRLQAGSTLGPPLIEYFEQHAREEAEHEEWLLQDLAVLGFSREAVLAEVGHPAIAAMVGAEYYWIRHAHPVALLGMFAVLEGFPPLLPHLDEVQRRAAVPDEALRMLRQHATLDVAHADELFQLIDDLPITEAQAGLIGISALHTMSALGDFFRTLVMTGPGPAVTADLLSG